MLDKEELIIKVISNNSSEQETDELNAWRKEKPEHDLYYQHTLTLWNNLERAKIEITPNVDEAWNRLSQKMIFQKKSNSRYLKIAASVLIILTIGITANYMFNTNGSSENGIAVNEQSTKNNTNENKTAQALGKLIKIHSTDSKMEDFLQDSSLVILNENTDISYREFADNNTRLVFLNGEAFFDVVHKKERFMVSTDKINVKVIGTAFGVKAIKNETVVEVVVEEGTVEAYEIANPKNKIVIKAKEKCEYNIQTHEFTKTEAKKKNRWWKGFFSKLKKIIDRLKHRKEEAAKEE